MYRCLRRHRRAGIPLSAPSLTYGLPFNSQRFPHSPIASCLCFRRRVHAGGFPAIAHSLPLPPFAPCSHTRSRFAQAITGCQCAGKPSPLPASSDCSRRFLRISADWRRAPSLPHVLSAAGIARSARLAPISFALPVPVRRFSAAIRRILSPCSVLRYGQAIPRRNGCDALRRLYPPIASWLPQSNRCRCVHAGRLRQA